MPRYTTQPEKRKYPGSERSVTTTSARPSPTNGVITAGAVSPPSRVVSIDINSSPAENDISTASTGPMTTSAVPMPDAPIPASA